MTLKHRGAIVLTYHSHKFMISSSLSLFNSPWDFSLRISIKKKVRSIKWYKNELNLNLFVIQRLGNRLKMEYEIESKYDVLNYSRYYCKLKEINVSPYRLPQQKNF